MGASNFVTSHYYTEIDPELCSVCGIGVDERCQVKAIAKGNEFSRVSSKQSALVCGLCASACPTEAITMVHKKPEDRSSIPKDNDVWMEERGRQRGVDFSQVKQVSTTQEKTRWQ